jgi:ribonuclease D
MPEGLMRNCGEELLECIRRAEVPDPPAPLDLRPRPDPQSTALVKKLATVNQAVAAELALSPELLATRRDLEQIVAGNRAVSPLSGWRAQVIGERLLRAL